MIRYIVTFSDITTSNNKPKVLTVCKTEEEAKAFIRNDMEEYMDFISDPNYVCDFDKMNAYMDGYNYGCEWNYECVEIQ